jgi:hypothetical protein
LSSRRKHAAIRRANERADAAEQRRMLAEYQLNVVKQAAEVFAHRAEIAEQRCKAMAEQAASLWACRAPTPIVVDASSLDGDWLRENLRPSTD